MIPVIEWDAWIDDMYNMDNELVAKDVLFIRGRWSTDLGVIEYHCPIYERDEYVVSVETLITEAANMITNDIKQAYAYRKVWGNER